MRQAPMPGFTTATMMCGTVETEEERIEHMMRLRTFRTRPAASLPSSPGATSRNTPSTVGLRKRASIISGHWRWRGSSSTTSTTSRRRG